MFDDSLAEILTVIFAFPVKIVVFVPVLPFAVFPPVDTFVFTIVVTVELFN